LQCSDVLKSLNVSLILVTFFLIPILPIPVLLVLIILVLVLLVVTMTLVPFFITESFRCLHLVSVNKYKEPNRKPAGDTTK